MKNENPEKKRKSLAKRLFKAIGFLVLFVFAALLIAPLFFKGTLVRIVKQEINKNLHATVDFEKASLSLIREFPNLTLDLNKLQIINKAPFNGEQLLFVEALSLTINLRSILKDGPVELRRIALNQPDIKLVINTDGQVNWDITLPAETDDDTQESTGEAMVFNLRSIRFSKGNLHYNDQELDMEVLIEDINGTASGRFSEEQAVISTDLSAASLDFLYEGFAWLKNVEVRYNAIIDSDFENSIYTFKRNWAYLNDLALSMDGSVGFMGDDMVLLLTFESVKSEFKSLLSLLPQVYQKDFEKVNAEGQFSFYGAIKGNYSSSSMPGFNVDLKVNNAAFSYPELPAKMERINIDLLVDNKTGDADATIIDLKKFDFELDKNPFKAKLLLTKPVSDPKFDFTANGKIDLAKLNQLIPLEEDGLLIGLLQLDVGVAARLSDIEKQAYKDIKAHGSVLANGIRYSDAAENAIAIENAQLNISPAYLDLVNMQLEMAGSDFELSGRLDDYLAYYLSNGTLKGRIDLKSKLLDASALLKMFDEGEETDGADTVAFSLELPKRIDLVVDASAQKLLYEDYELKNAVAKLHYKDQRLVFDPLSAELLGGNMQMKGFFDGADKENPHIDIDFNIKRFDIPVAYNQIGMMQQIAPVAQQTTGNFSTDFKMKAKLDAGLNPVYESISGLGKLSTSRIIIEATNTLTQLADMTGNESLKRLVSDGLFFDFAFVNGRIFQEPTNIKFNQFEMLVGGSVGFDQSIDYNLVLPLPFGSLGPKITTEVTKLLQEAAKGGIKIETPTTINLRAKLSGEVTKPAIALDYGDMAGDLRNRLQQQAKEALERELAEAKAKARAEADRILERASQQTAELMQQAEATAASIRAEAARAAAALHDEANRQAAAIEMEGKQRGMVAEMAAKETAKKVRSEADNTATKMVNEADKRAHEVLQQAQRQADEIMRNARERADAVLE